MEVVTTLPRNLQPLITSDAQIRALAKLPENKRADAISQAEKNGGVTAENISLHGAKPAPKTNVTNPVTLTRTRNSTFLEKMGSETASFSKNTPPKKPEIVFDKIGTPIPVDALPYWNRRDEVREIFDTLSKFRVKIKSARDSGDYLWVKHGQEAYEYLSRAYSYITDASPDCVCLHCQGSPSLQPDGCNTCGSTGMISQYRFDHFLPKELREIRLKSNAEYAKTHQLDNVR